MDNNEQPFDERVARESARGRFAAVLVGAGALALGELVSRAVIQPGLVLLVAVLAVVEVSATPPEVSGSR